MGAANLTVVTTLYETNAREIPEMLRKLASDIESPPVQDARPDQCVCIIRDSASGRLNVYGWGDIAIDDSLAMLAIANRQLCASADGGTLWPIPQGGTTPKESA